MKYHRIGEHRCQHYSNTRTIPNIKYFVPINGFGLKSGGAVSPEKEHNKEDFDGVLFIYRPQSNIIFFILFLALVSSFFLSFFFLTGPSQYNIIGYQKMEFFYSLVYTNILRTTSVDQRLSFKVSLLLWLLLFIK